MWRSIYSYEMIEWVYLMAYQAKLIEEGSWCTLAESFHYLHIHIKMRWSIDPHDRLNEFIWWLIKSNSLKKVRDASLQNLSIIFTFISIWGDQLTLMVDWMSLSEGLSSQTCEEGSWCIFAELFYYCHIHIKVGDWMRIREDSTESTPRGGE